jgi:spermidine synthase
VGVRRRRSLLLVVAAVIAGAGVAYELGLMLLGTVTVGSTERANAVVLGAAMFGMGVGATTGGRLARRPVEAFVGVESLLAVLGAAAAPFLYWTWASLDAFWGPLLAVAFVLGACIGAEMPLLAALNDRLAEQKAATVVAAFTAADYFGALIGAVAFAFVIRPWLGLVNGTIVVAVVNVAMAAAVAFIVPSRRVLPVVATIVAASVGLIVVAASADRVTDNGRQRLYRDPIVARRESAIQEIIVTRRVHPGGVVDTRLFLDGDLQLSSIDSHRYHESLAHPVVSLTSARRVLVLGGGDCVAVREVLRHPSVEHVTLVELDPEVTAMAGEVPELLALNGGACSDPRVEVVNDDAFTWVRSQARTDVTRYDAVIADFPDPDTPALGRLYSVELYGLVRQVLAPGGALVVQCGSPFFAPEAFWTCEATLEAAGWAPTPYHVDVPSFGDWGFHLAQPAPSGGSELPLVGPVPVVDPRLEVRFLTGDVLRAAQVFPPDVARGRVTVRPSTILDPAIVAAAQGAWIGYS